MTTPMSLFIAFGIMAWVGGLIWMFKSTMKYHVDPNEARERHKKIAEKMISELDVSISIDELEKGMQTPSWKDV